MKLLPKNKRKTIIYTSILIVLIGGIIYVNFFFDQQSSDLADTAGLLPSGDDSAPVSTTLNPASATLLPFGSNIDLDVLSSDEFKKLNTPPAFSVSPEELGRPEPFTP